MKLQDVLEAPEKASHDSAAFGRSGSCHAVFDV